MNANATNTCRQAHVLMARNNRGTNGIGHLMQATGEVIGGNIGHDDHKLVAAIAHKLVSRTNSAAYGCRHSTERKVAGMTATRIVEDPKIIKVDHRNAGIHTGASELFLVIPAIVYTRQHVGVDKVLFCSLLLIDRTHHQQDMRLAFDLQRAQTGAVLGTIIEQLLRYLIGTCQGLKTRLTQTRAAIAGKQAVRLALNLIGRQQTHHGVGLRDAGDLGGGLLVG